ncbi:MAG: ATP-binding protein [Planctomycetota bacterium]
MRIRSLTARFSLTLLLSTIVPLLVVGWIGMRLLRDGLERVVLPSLENRAMLMGAEVIGLLNQIDRDLSNWSPLAQRAAGLGGDIQDFEDYLLHSTRDFHANYQLVLLVDSAGAVLADIWSRGDGNLSPSERDALTPEDVAGESWFKTLQAGAVPIWSGRHLSSYLHRDTAKNSRNPSDYSLSLAFGLPQPDGSRAAMLALIRWQRIQDIIDAGGRSSATGDDLELPGAMAFLCDERGEVVAHSDRQEYHRVLEPDEDLHGLLSGSAGTLSYVSADGQSTHAAAVPLEENLAGFSWRACISAPDSELFALADATARVLLLVTALFLGTLLVWSILAARRIVRPVRMLAAATERVAQGDLTARVVTKGGDELADLGRSFNDMAQDLSTSRDQLRDAERQAAWAEMARQVAHEIKNPLTPMRMSAQLMLKAQRDGDSRLGELIDRTGRTVLEQADALARIAADFRSFAGPPERQLEVLTPADLLDDVAVDFGTEGSEGDPRVSVVNQADGVTVHVDRLEIRRVFMNLIQNALEAGGDSGTVTVRAETRDEFVRFTVHDAGPGVPEEVCAHLFEPYFTTRSSGTGLGLAISRRSVEDHGGKIGLLESRPGSTTFFFELPTGG